MPLLALDVAPGLRAIVLVHIDDGHGGALGRFALLRQAAEVVEGLAEYPRARASPENSTETVTVWPSTTGTRLQWALTLHGWS